MSTSEQEPVDLESDIIANEVALEQLIPALAGDDDTSSEDLTIEPVRQLPSILSMLTSCTINMFLPFVNGMCLGFGEIFAHELGFRWGWSGSRVYRPERYVKVISN